MDVPKVDTDALELLDETINELVVLETIVADPDEVEETLEIELEVEIDCVELCAGRDSAC